MVENIVGSGENVGYQHFLLSHNVYRRPFPRGVKICHYMVNEFLRQKPHPLAPSVLDIQSWLHSTTENENTGISTFFLLTFQVD